MKTLLPTLLIMASIAGPAAAQEIRVSLEGKSPATIREDIARAASTVCTSAFREGEVGVHELNACQRAVADDAMQQARLLTKPS
jgi:hypothetical protein